MSCRPASAPVLSCPLSPEGRSFWRPCGVAWCLASEPPRGTGLDSPEAQQPPANHRTHRCMWDSGKPSSCQRKLLGPTPALFQALSHLGTRILDERRTLLSPPPLSWSLRCSCLRVFAPVVPAPSLRPGIFGFFRSQLESHPLSPQGFTRGSSFAPSQALGLWSWLHPKIVGPLFPGSRCPCHCMRVAHSRGPRGPLWGGGTR